MKIIIPSYKRADCLETSKWLYSAIVVVPQSQKQEYEDLNPHLNLIAIPDELDGSISKKRNAILDLFPDEDILMMDDDIKSVGYHEDAIMNRVDDKTFVEFALNMFQMAKECKTILWGVNVQSDSKFYREYSPFSLSSIILGPLMGIRNVSKLRFSEELANKEDYDFSIEVLREYRKILKNNKWYYVCGHITNKGGIVGMRNADNEIRKGILLQKKWGSRIINIKRKSVGGKLTINPIVKVPIKGI